jgi:hypothetical protein
MLAENLDESDAFLDQDPDLLLAHHPGHGLDSHEESIHRDAKFLRVIVERVLQSRTESGLAPG